MLNPVQHFSSRIIHAKDGVYLQVTAFFDRPGVTVVFHQKEHNPDGQPQFALQYICPQQDIKRETPDNWLRQINGYQAGHVWVNDKLITELPNDDFTANGCG